MTLSSAVSAPHVTVPFVLPTSRPASSPRERCTSTFRRGSESLPTNQPLADVFVDGGRGITASLLLRIEVDPVKPCRRVAGVDRV